MKIKLDENMPTSVGELLAFDATAPDEWRGCLVIVTQHKIRVLAPQRPMSDGQ